MSNKNHFSRLVVYWLALSAKFGLGRSSHIFIYFIPQCMRDKCHIARFQPLGRGKDQMLNTNVRHTMASINLQMRSLTQLQDPVANYMGKYQGSLTHEQFQKSRKLFWRVICLRVMTCISTFLHSIKHRIQGIVPSTKTKLQVLSANKNLCLWIDLDPFLLSCSETLYTNPLDANPSASISASAMKPYNLPT